MSDHFFSINLCVINKNIKNVLCAYSYNIFIFIKNYIKHFYDNQYYTDLLFFIIKMNNEHNGSWGKCILQYGFISCNLKLFF